MIGFTPLFADLEDVVPFAIFIIIVILSVGGQLINKFKGMQQGRPQRPGGGPPQPPRQQAGPVADELREFLRRAAQRGGAGGPAAHARPQQARPQPPQPVGRPPRPEEPVAAEVLEPFPEESVAAHVREHLGGKKFEGRLKSELGKEVALADDKLEERLHKVFDHQLGRLAGTLGESSQLLAVEEAASPEDHIASLPPTAAAGLAAMFADPIGVRQAILIHEILQRPEHRWS